MKISIVLLFFPVASLAWQTTIFHWKEKVGDILRNPFRRSRVPQFILDAGHPWVVENQRRLEKLPDAKSYICIPPSESASDGGLGRAGNGEIGLDIPPDLFHYLEVNNGRFGVDRPGWPNALVRLREIRDCPAAVSQATTFVVDIYAYRDGFDSPDKKILEPSQPPGEALDLFADILGNMTSLETLKWRIPSADAPYAEEHFLRRGLVLPSVDRLEPGAQSHFLVPMCPNITALENGGGWEWLMRDSGDMDSELPLLQAAMLALKLKWFAMHTRGGWTKQMIQDLVSVYLPGIERLGLRGGLSRRDRYGDGENSEGFALEVRKSNFRYTDDAHTLQETLRILGTLQNLTYLELPPAYQLNIGWDGGPGCGNAYDGPGGRRYERQVVGQGAEAVDSAAALVLKALPRLIGFSIGSTQANITRYENGTREASFPWTGRKGEWVMEKVPLRPYESDLDDDAGWDDL
ncbi:hypothetical protein F4802DRAFT_615075 [Xylaria palmicola]|nr:hypothetical protein F4802DRAFT_615075 [Xylaria palmicola]